MSSGVPGGHRTQEVVSSILISSTNQWMRVAVASRAAVGPTRLLQRPDVRDEGLHLVARQMLALVSRRRQGSDAVGDDVRKIGIAASLHRVAPVIRDFVFLSDRRVAAGVGAVTGDALGLEDGLPR
jgi:hypothetical protein